VGDGHYARLEGGRAAVEVTDGVIYLAMSLRNVGSGMAVIHGWYPAAQWLDGAQRMVSRFALNSPGDGATWLSSVGRHWNLDRRDPR
jgi:hypothetical protein